MDALLRTVVHQAQVRDQRVALDLVHGRGHASGLDDLVEHLHGEVGDADRLRLALWQLQHRLPGVDQRDVHVEIHLLTAGTLLGHQLAAILLEGNRPVDEVQVKVVEVKLLQTLVESRGDSLRAVVDVP